LASRTSTSDAGAEGDHAGRDDRIDPLVRLPTRAAIAVPKNLELCLRHNRVGRRRSLAAKSVFAWSLRTHPRCQFVPEFPALSSLVPDRRNALRADSHPCGNDFQTAWLRTLGSPTQSARPLLHPARRRSRLNIATIGPPATNIASRGIVSKPILASQPRMPLTTTPAAMPSGALYSAPQRLEQQLTS
jgi:hypothetical protein